MAKRKDVQGIVGFSGTIYGDSGIGKTKLIDSFPPDEVLVVDIEGGGSILHNNMEYEVMPKPVNKETAQAYLNKLNEIYGKLRFGTTADGKPFREWEKIKYVFIDSASEMETYFQQVQSIFSNQIMVRLKEFGEASQITKKFIIQFRDLKDPANTWHNRPINTIFICGEQPIETLKTESLTTTKTGPMLTKKFSMQIVYLMDFVGHMEMSSGKRMIRFEPTTDIVAKSRYDSIQGIVSQPQPPLPMNFYELVVKRVEADLAGSPVQQAPAGVAPGQRKAPGVK